MIASSRRGFGKHFVSNAYCGFIDAGYLHAQGSRACRIPGVQLRLGSAAAAIPTRSLGDLFLVVTGGAEALNGPLESR